MFLNSLIFSVYKISVGDIEIEKEIEIVAQEEEIIVDFPSEPSGSSIARDDETGDMPEISDDKRYSECSRQVTISYLFVHIICFLFVLKF